MERGIYCSDECRDEHQKPGGRLDDLWALAAGQPLLSVLDEESERDKKA